MTKQVTLILIGFFLFPIFLLGQKTHGFKIDTAAILANENLENFVQKLRTDSFQISVDRKAIPIFIKKQLNSLVKGFSIANPNEPWQCCCTSPKRLPDRQLTFLAKSKEVLVMTYKTGGIGVSTHLLLIKFDKNKIIDLWTGYCFSEVKNVNSIVFYIDEAMKNRKELNTNIVIF